MRDLTKLGLRNDPLIATAQNRLIAMPCFFSA
jgi:hypothetical protein